MQICLMEMLSGFEGLFKHVSFFENLYKRNHFVLANMVNMTRWCSNFASIDSITRKAKFGAYKELCTELIPLNNVVTVAIILNQKFHRIDVTCK